MSNTQKLHFVHYLDYGNVGDWTASPLNYFADYFLTRYNVVYHNIAFMKWNLIEPHDAIILGGGGLLENVAPFQEAINRMFDMCGCVIGWGLGFHTREDTPELPKIDYLRFTMLSIRDYDFPEKHEYVPCVTCMLPQLRKKSENKHDLGVINHAIFPITDSGLPIIDNSVGIDEMTDFIAASETILTTSYHAAYWSLLMGKKTIVAFAWANKFMYFKCKPVIIEKLSVEAVNKIVAEGEAETYTEYLDECIELNLAFFKKVKAHLEDYIPEKRNVITTLELLKKQESITMQHENTVENLNERMNTMVEQVNSLVGQIEQRFEDLENRIK